MATFSITEPEYYINNVECSEDKFIPECLKQLRELISVSDSVDCEASEGVDNLFTMNKSSGFRSFRNVENLLTNVIEELYERYDLVVNKNSDLSVIVTNDGEEVTVFKAKGNVVVQQTSDNQSQKIDVGTVEDLDVNIPVLTNKAYNSFVNLCNETQQFLVDYSEIGQKTSWSLKKTDVNAVAKAVFSPIRSWDSVGDVCKMKKEEFDLLKSNLVQFSVDNACAKLSEYKWSEIFDWLKDRKTNCIKFSQTNDSFIAKIRTNVIDSKKNRLGTIIVTTSIVVDESRTIPDTTKGRLQVHPSNISFNIIAR